MTKFLMLEQITEFSRLDLMALVSDRIAQTPEGGKVWVVIAQPGDFIGIPHPYNGPEARTQAGNAYSAGYSNLPKADFPPIDEFLWQIGRNQAAATSEIEDAHAAIPESLAPMKDSTQGDKSKLADRIKVLVEMIETSRRREDQQTEGI